MHYRLLLFKYLNPIVHIPKFTFRSRKIYTSWAESKYFSIHKSRFSFDSYVSDVLKFSYSTKTRITFYISGVKEMSEDQMKTKSKYWIILYILSSLFSSFFFSFHSAVICEEICWFLFLPQSHKELLQPFLSMSQRRNNFDNSVRITIKNFYRNQKFWKLLYKALFGVFWNQN